MRGPDIDWYSGTIKYEDRFHWLGSDMFTLFRATLIVAWLGFCRYWRGTFSCVIVFVSEASRIRHESSPILDNMVHETIWP
jgi:hypothetical protein